jgi:diphosphomevalonate decarboxylase
MSTLREFYRNSEDSLLTENIRPGKVGWVSPSNIALVKYWGKHGVQLPSNPSISFTLNNATTRTEIEYSPRASASSGLDLEFYFEGDRNDAFEARIRKFLISVLDIFPVLKQLHLKIHSSNTFPHSSGIASSASAMSALSLCLCSLEDNLFNPTDDAQFRQKASFVSRLASGSACRSIYSGAAVWGRSPMISDSSDEYAVPAEDRLHASFKGYRDAILIMSSNKKSVSSSAGHKLMDQHPYAEVRFKQARLRLDELLNVLQVGNRERFVTIVENEALTLHGLMMTSELSYILMEPATIDVIRKIRSFRESSGVPACFTLDAGPNVHLLYPEKHKEEVLRLINDELLFHCEGRKWIDDKMGEGPVQIA